MSIFDPTWSDPRGKWETLVDLATTPDGIARSIAKAKGRTPKSAREVYLREVLNHDMLMATLWTSPEINMENGTCRVSIMKDGVDVIVFGLTDIDANLEGHYDSVDLLPNWVQERIALLNMLPATPPTSDVEGVGRRITSHVYWVYIPAVTPR